MTWYRENRRDLPWREDKEPYHVWVSEIMLQQTRVEAVREYYLRFMRALPTISDLAAAEEETLLKLWQGLGYYNRIRNMHKAAQQIEAQMGGIFPQEFDAIKALPGIGDYTAGAIASICFNQKTAAVDGNVLRVMSRLNNDDTDILNAGLKKRITAYLSSLYPEKDCGDFTQGLIELVPKGYDFLKEIGKLTQDRQDGQAACEAKAAGTAAALPVKAKKKARRKVDMTVFILQAPLGTAVCRRAETGLLAGLYQLPNVEKRLTAAQAIEQVERWGCAPKNLLRSTDYCHVFTHVEWHMTGYFIAVEKMPKIFQWASDAQLAAEIPLPTAFGYFLK